MFRSKRKVKPTTEQNDNELSSSDNDNISSLVYVLRGVRKSVISKSCNDKEIEFIEKRFQDTSKVIYKEVDLGNPHTLRRAYKQPFRSDIANIKGEEIGSMKVLSSMNNRPKEIMQANLDEIWDSGIVSSKKTYAKVAVKKARKLEENSTAEVLPERPRRNGLCRVT